MTVAPAVDLWPTLSLAVRIRVIRESDRQDRLGQKSALAAEFSRRTQLFRDRIELHVAGDVSVAKSLVLLQVRRQGVSSNELLARAEPEIARTIEPPPPPFLRHRLELEPAAEGRYLARLDDLVVARGDWFLLVSSDADLAVEWIEDPDGARFEEVRSIPLTGSVSRDVNLIAWRHDGRTVKPFSDLAELKTVSRGLVDEALQPWLNPDRDFSMSGLWGALANALEMPSGVPADMQRRAFMERIVGSNRSVRRRLARHSPFVALAALARWLALDSAAPGGLWQDNLGQNDETAIERLLSPIAEWRARNPGPAAAPIVPADTKSDVVGHFLSWARRVAGVKLNYPRSGSRSENDVALALLLLLNTRLAKQAEDIGVALTIPEVTDARGLELISMFARIFFSDDPNKIERRDTDFGFYRGVLGRAPGQKEQPRVRSLFVGAAPAAGPYCRIQDLNGLPRASFDALAEFDAIFARLTEAFRELQMAADTGLESLADLRAGVNASTSTVTPAALNKLSKGVSAKYPRTNPSWDHKRFLDLMQELVKAGSDPRDHARRALVLKRLREAERRLSERVVVAQGEQRILDSEGELEAAFVAANADEIIREAIQDPDLPQDMGLAERVSRSKKAAMARDNAFCNAKRAGVTGLGSRNPDAALARVLKGLQEKFEVHRNRLATHENVRAKLGNASRAIDFARDRLRRCTTKSLRVERRRTNEIEPRLAELKGAVERAEAAVAELDDLP